MRVVGSMWVSDIASICSFMFLLQSSNGQCGCVPSFDIIRPIREGLPTSTLMELLALPVVQNRLSSSGLYCECHCIDSILLVYWVGCDLGRFTCKDSHIRMLTSKILNALWRSKAMYFVQHHWCYFRYVHAVYSTVFTMWALMKGYVISGVLDTSLYVSQLKPLNLTSWTIADIWLAVHVPLYRAHSQTWGLLSVNAWAGCCNESTSGQIFSFHFYRNLRGMKHENMWNTLTVIKLYLPLEPMVTHSIMIQSSVWEEILVFQFVRQLTYSIAIL